MSAYRHPSPEASLADAQAAYIGAEKLAKAARADYLDAKRAQRAVWAPRIFAALVGLGVAVFLGAVAPRFVSWAMSPTAPPPCEDKVADIDAVSIERCAPGARAEIVGKMIVCRCPRGAEGGAL